MSQVDDSNGNGAVTAAEYALGLLDPAETAAFEALLARDAGARAELAFWQAQLSGLDAEFAEVAPPAGTLRRIERRLFPDRPMTGFWNSLAVWRSLAGGALAVAVLALGFALTRPVPPSPSELAMQMVAALEMDGSPARFVALYDQTTGAVRLTVLSGEALPEKDYELWAIMGDGTPRSMGVIPASGRAEMVIEAGHRDMIAPGTVLAVTLEPKGGSRTGAPTGPMMAKGMATQI